MILAKGRSSKKLGSIRGLKSCGIVVTAEGNTQDHQAHNQPSEDPPFLPNTGLVEYCFAHRILLAAYSPLRLQGQFEATQEAPLQDAELTAPAEGKGVTPAQSMTAGMRCCLKVPPRRVLGKIFRLLR